MPSPRGLILLTNPSRSAIHATLLQEEGRIASDADSFARGCGVRAFRAPIAGDLLFRGGRHGGPRAPHVYTFDGAARGARGRLFHAPRMPKYTQERDITGENRASADFHSALRTRDRLLRGIVSFSFFFSLVLSKLPCVFLLRSSRLAVRGVQSARCAGVNYSRCEGGSF